MSEVGTGGAEPELTRQPLYLHVGVPKSGTTYLQGLLADNRDRLKEVGYVYPYVRPEAMFHAAVELRGQHDRWGLPADLVEGSWQRLLDRVRTVGATGLISHEILAGALGPELERIGRDTAGFDLHVVVTARDLGRQATAHWQEEIKNGRDWSFEEFRQALSGPEESAANEVGFWRSQDLLAVVRRWSTLVPPEKLHLVVVPPPGTDPAELWRRFAEAVGLPAGVLDPGSGPGGNESLGVAQVALLRQVVGALDHRIPQPQYAHVVKRFFAQRILGSLRSRPAVTPAALRAELDDTVRGWLPELRASGFTQHGDLEELLSAAPASATADPDDVSPAELLDGVPEVIAELLVEVATLRARRDQHAPPPGGKDRRPRLSLRGRRRTR